MIGQMETVGSATAPLSPGYPEDPRRWFTLVIVVAAVTIAALDSTVLNVAIPTILKDFHTTLPSLQWVITGYSLTFAACLIIGGRLGDIFGMRRMFIIGAALFGIGSLIASLSTGVVSLVIGEAIVEGFGASLMLPATLGILSSTFVGQERATAFSAWAATLGAAVAFGPLLGGFLTTNYSWRWAFRLNVIIVPFAIVGAMLFMRKVPLSGRRERIDVRGALLIASGMFCLIFAISEGASYGWIHPARSLTIVGRDVWPVGRAVSIVPFVFGAAAALLAGFYVVERSRERAARDPLFDFSQLNRRGFRWGLATLLLLAMGQVAFLFILSVFLQDSQHLSAMQTGLWLMPSGLFIVGGSQVGSRLTRRRGTTSVVRIGLVFEAVGLAAIALAVTPSVTLIGLMPGFALFGVGIGFAASQLTNVILAEVAPEKSGAASGANTTVRMIGSSLGIAVMSAMLSSGTTQRAIRSIQGAQTLPAALRIHSIAAIHARGLNFAPLAGTSSRDIATLRHAMDGAIAAGARPPLIYATAVVVLGAALSFLIPRVGPFDMTPQELAGHDETSRENEVVAESATLV